MRRGLKSALVYAAGVKHTAAFAPSSSLVPIRRDVNCPQRERTAGLRFSALAGGRRDGEEGSGPRSFDSLGLRPELIQSIKKLGYAGLTDIQDRALPPALAGLDVVGKAKTGSGKTAVFGLALLQRLDLARDHRDGRVQALVLSPTRELAVQLVGSIRGLASSMAGVRVLAATGGMPSRDQRTGLERGAHVVVATPGRCLQLLEGGWLDARNVSCLVMDEADTLLDMGFEDEVNRILKFLPPPGSQWGRQTLLFSATWADRVEKLSKRVQLRPEIVSDGEDRGAMSTTNAAAQVDRSLLQQSALLFEGGEEARLGALLQVLATATATRDEKCVVFCETRIQCKSVAAFLTSRGADALALHGELEQNDREKTLVRFRNKSCRILVATNVASRGLDVAGVSLVVCFELNDDPDVHIHRVGRTARAESSGRAVSLVRVGRATGGEVQRGDEVSKLDAIDAALGDDPIARDTWRPPRDRGDGDRELQGWAAEWSTLLILGGRKEKLRPGDVLGALSGTDVGIKGERVGKIDVTEQRTWVAVQKSVSSMAVEGLNKIKIKKRRFKVHLIK